MLNAECYGHCFRMLKICKGSLRSLFPISKLHFPSSKKKFVGILLEENMKLMKCHLGCMYLLCNIFTHQISHQNNDSSGCK